MKTHLLLAYFFSLSLPALAMEQEQKRAKVAESQKKSATIPSLVNLVLRYLARHELEKNESLPVLRPALRQAYGELPVHLTVSFMYRLFHENAQYLLQKNKSISSGYDPINILLVLAEYLMEKSIRETQDTTLQQQSDTEKVAYIEEQALNCKCQKGCSLEHTALKLIYELNRFALLKDMGQLRPLARSVLFKCPLTLTYLVNNQLTIKQEAQHALKQLLYSQKDEEACELIQLLPTDILTPPVTEELSLANCAQLNKCNKTLALLRKDHKLTPKLGHHTQSGLFYPNPTIQQDFLLGNTDRVKSFIEVCQKTNPPIPLSSVRLRFNTAYDIYPLLHALESGYSKIAELLIQHGAPITISTLIQDTTLHFACHRGDFKIVELLLSKGTSALINTPSLLGLTPFHNACRQGTVSLVKLLLDKGANVNLPITIPSKGSLGISLQGATPLAIACLDNNVPLVKLLIQRGAHIEVKNESDSTPLHLACGSEKGLEIVPLLLEKAHSLLDRDHYLAYINAKNKEGDTPFLEACSYGHNSLIKYLLTCDGIITQDSNALSYYLASPALEEQTLPSGDFIIENPKTNSRSLENKDHWLDLSIVKSLFTSIEDINEQDTAGETLLHKVTAVGTNGSLEIAQFLLSKGASATIADNKGRTPLHYECKGRGNPDTVKLLLDNGAHVDSKNYKGRTPLHLAICDSNKRIAKVLLDRGATINAADNAGNTSLHHALNLCEKHRLKMVAFLLSNGATPTLKNKEGKTPLDLAQESNDPVLIELFAKHSSMRQNS
jgi:ankyrin repeat protein